MRLLKKILLAFVLIATCGFISLVIAEFYFRSNEKSSAYNPEMLDWKDIMNKNGTKVLLGGGMKPNFNNTVVGENGPIKWTNNSIGLRYKKEISIPKKENTIRVLVLGASYFVGYRIAQDSTFLAKLEAGLQVKHPQKNIEVLPAYCNNAIEAAKYLQTFKNSIDADYLMLGLIITKDFYEGHYLINSKEYHFKYNQKGIADSIIFNGKNDDSHLFAKMSTLEFPDSLHDINLHNKLSLKKINYVIKNKLNAFGDDYIVCQKLRHSIFKNSGSAIYNVDDNYNHVTFFDKNNGLSMYLKSPPSFITKSKKNIFDAVDVIAKICEEEQIKLSVTTIGQRYTIQEEDWEETLFHYRLKEDKFDLTAIHIELQNHFSAKAIPYYDGTEYLKSIHDEHEINLFLSGSDMHFNSRGNHFLSQYLLENFKFN